MKPTSGLIVRVLTKLFVSRPCLSLMVMEVIMRKDIIMVFKIEL